MTSQSERRSYQRDSVQTVILCTDVCAMVFDSRSSNTSTKPTTKKRICCRGGRHCSGSLRDPTLRFTPPERVPHTNKSKRWIAPRSTTIRASRARSRPLCR
jgi:hypothetical protein